MTEGQKKQLLVEITFSEFSDLQELLVLDYLWCYFGEEPIYTKRESHGPGV